MFIKLFLKFIIKFSVRVLKKITNNVEIVNLLNRFIIDTIRFV